MTTEERHAAVLAAVDELERPNTVDIQRRTGIPTRSLGRDLGYLREAGVIEFVGAPQNGFYRRK
jgi:DeoR/GlpR family transcriptional regulator of sugar metabolism